jgi:predicted peroxiredoxin
MIKSLSSVVFLSLLIVTVSFANAEEKVPFFYNITTDDSWTAGMAAGHANNAADRGHSVTVFLNVRGVHIADKKTVQGTFGPTGKTPAQLLQSLIKKGHAVLVCGTCMKVAGVTENDLMAGAKVSTPDLTFGALTEKDTIVLSY